MRKPGSIAIGYTATSSSAHAVAIGAGATATSNNTVAIGAGATTDRIVRVGASVRFSYQGRYYTGEVVGNEDGIYRIKADVMPPDCQMDPILRAPFLVEEIDALQRFTEASHR